VLQMASPWLWCHFSKQWLQQEQEFCNYYFLLSKKIEYFLFFFRLLKLIFLLFYRFSWTQKHVTGLFLPGIQINNTYATLSIWWQVAKTQQITECIFLFDLCKMQVTRSYF
jgi:hypothetical protein